MSDAQSMRPIVLILLLSVGFALVACGGSSSTASPTAPAVAPPTAPSEVEKAPIYRGLGLDAVETYAATFEATFTAEGDPSSNWTYTLDVLASDSPPALRRSLSIDGAPQSQDLGDVTLILRDDTQYMIGEAAGSAGCLVFPATVDLEASFLTPDDFLPPPALHGILTPAGEETVAGQAGRIYTFEADTLGDFTDVSGELVLSEDGTYVLRYDFAADTVDTRFAAEQAGRLTWRFEVADFAPDEAIEVPGTCDLGFPIMDDAADVARLPGLIAYTSPSSSADVVAFYEETLPAEGWGRYALPTTRDDVTLLVYARGGELLNISVTAVEGGSEVQLFVEDRP